MSNESMMTQADFEAIMDRLEKGPLNLTGKSWRDTPDDPAVAELRERFILPVIEEYVARRTAAQPEREAVLEGTVVDEIERIVRVAMQDEFLSGSDWSDGRVRKRAARARSATREIIAALTTPVPAVSTDEIVAALEEATDAVDQLERSVRFLTPENVRPDTSNARALVERARAILSRIRGEGE